MTLREVLNILNRNKAAEIAKCGRSASWHWYQVGEKQKVPEMQTLVLWADHLKLTDADLGELIRDALQTRVRIMEKLSKDDKRRIQTRSVLRRDLAKEIAAEMTEEEVTKRERELEKKAQAAKNKQRFLAQQEKEQARLERLKEYEEKLKKLRMSNGNN
tara:strand:+ start:541 stop:1017 length:477 start_codon:yes stop_codon:yes gene_type:complete